MKKNGTTSKGTTRWRCKDPNCGSSTTRTRTDLTQARNFKAFVSYVTSTATLSELAGQQRVSRWTLDRRFEPFWLIDVPNDGAPQRVYEQIFIDATTSLGPDPRKVDTSGASYAAVVSIAEVSASKTSGATRLHQECRLRVL